MWLYSPSTTMHGDWWVVPYSGHNPPILVGGALCLADSSCTCGWCPMPSKTPCVHLCGQRMADLRAPRLPICGCPMSAWAANEWPPNSAYAVNK